MKCIRPLIITFSIVISISLQNFAFASNEPIFLKSTGIDGKPQILNWYIYKPEKEGPFAAIVILHGCGGVTTHNHDWAEHIKNCGYVALIVDSFNSRSVTNICRTVRKVKPTERAFDTYGAVLYLQQLTYVDKDKIGV